MKRHAIALIAGTLLAAPGGGTDAFADGIRPVTVQIRETEPELFLAQWRVPGRIPARAMPSPVMPEGCERTGERSMEERSGAWLLRQMYRCPKGLSGRLLRIDYPFPNATVPTLLRVELLSGAQYARMLNPGEDAWQVPERSSGGASPLLGQGRDALLGGIAHFAGNPIHLGFLLALVLLGPLGAALRLAGLFTAGQVAAVLVAAATGFRSIAPFAEIGVAVAALLLAAESLRPAEERRQIAPLSTLAGFVHGLGLAGFAMAATPTDGSILYDGLAAVLGLDAALLAGLLLLFGIGRLVPRWRSRIPVRAVAAYVVAIACLALAIAMPLPAENPAQADRPIGLQLPGLAVAGTSGTPMSRRIARQTPDVPLQSFVVVEAFEVRHEILVRLRDAAERFGLSPAQIVPVEDQQSLKRLIADRLSAVSAIAIDGNDAQPVDRRVDFLSIDSRGARSRLSPVPEALEDAWIGVTFIYLTETTPREVSLTWNDLDSTSIIPATVSDPESSRSVELTSGQPELHWENELSEDPAPVVRSTTFEPATVWVPVAALLPLSVMVFFILSAARNRHRVLSLSLARVMLACALLLGPVGGMVLSMPPLLGATPDAGRARRILSGVLPNVYRAFEFPTESAVYDRLALSVTGEPLTEIYLEHRRAVAAEERGGAKARVEAVEVLQVTSVQAADEGGFAAEAAWTVGGTVTHFGHRHFRQNRYDARVVLVPVDGCWKIRAIEVLDEKRLR